jgi:hypothetical protein
MDEEYMERRKLNIQNYGNSWLKPPGVPKTLYQQREEKREMEEHQEALRRDALAQELAEAEAEGVDELLQGEGMDGDMEEVRDLDDDVPEAETTALDVDDSDDEVENEVEEVQRNEQGAYRPIVTVARSLINNSRAAAAARLPARLPDDVYRETLARGEDAGAAGFGEDGGSTIDEEDQSQMLQEEDLVHEGGEDMHDLDMDMDADLDADIPEAETGGYEHTDTEEELSSSDDESVDAGRLPSQRAATTSMIRSDGTQTSMDLSSIISNGSSQLGSSPQQFSGLRGRRAAP